jgi:hypothetical protein
LALYPLRDRVEHPAPTDRPVLVIGAGRLASQCAWCGAIKTTQGHIGAGLLRVVHRIKGYRISHGVCPDCLAAEMQKVREMRA